MSKKKSKVLAVITSLLTAGVAGAAVYFSLKPKEAKKVEYYDDEDDEIEEKSQPKESKIKKVSLSVRSAGDTCSKVGFMMSSVGNILDTANQLFGPKPTNEQYQLNQNGYDPRGCYYANMSGHPVGSSYYGTANNRYWDNNSYIPRGYSYNPDSSYNMNCGGNVYFTGMPITSR